MSMTSSAKLYLAIHIILWMRSCDHSLATLTFLWAKLSQSQFYKDLTRKLLFLEGWSWFKFNNLGLALGMNLKFYARVAKGLKLKVRRFYSLAPTFVVVTGEKLVGGLFALPILNGVKGANVFRTFINVILKISTLMSSVLSSFKRFLKRHRNLSSSKLL